MLLLSLFVFTLYANYSCSSRPFSNFCNSGWWSSVWCVPLGLSCRPVKYIHIAVCCISGDGFCGLASRYDEQYIPAADFPHRHLAQIAHEALLGCCWRCLVMRSVGHLRQSRLRAACCCALRTCGMKISCASFLFGQLLWCEMSWRWHIGVQGRVEVIWSML